MHVITTHIKTKRATRRQPRLGNMIIVKQLRWCVWCNSQLGRKTKTKCDSIPAHFVWQKPRVNCEYYIYRGYVKMHMCFGFMRSDKMHYVLIHICVMSILELQVCRYLVTYTITIYSVEPSMFAQSNEDAQIHKSSAFGRNSTNYSAIMHTRPTMTHTKNNSQRHDMYIYIYAFCAQYRDIRRFNLWDHCVY